MTTAEEKREALSKAMGAAFLSHQVAELERSVDSMAFSRDARLYDPSGSWRGSRGGRGGRGGAGRGGGSGRNGVKRERRIVDASALVHALPVLKRWVREDAYQLVVPLQALSILDILKRAPNPLHDLARDATRFLETQLNIARQIEASFGGIEADSRIRLRAQAANEELSWTEVEKLFTVPEGFVVEVPPVDPTASLDDEEDGEPLPPPQPTANDIPRSLRSSLQCALYFQQSLSKELPAPLLLFNSLDAPAPSPYVLPPSSSEPTPPPRAHNAPPPPPDFDSLSLGDTLTFWIETFFPSVALASIPSSQIVAAKEWLKAQAAAKEASEKGGKGRGGGGGGGGGGRGSRGGDGGRTGRGGQGGRGRGAEAGRGGGGSSIGADESRRLFVP